MRARVRLMIGLGALALGLVASQLPSHTVFADISVCTSCDAVDIGINLVSDVPTVGADSTATPTPTRIPGN